MQEIFSGRSIFKGRRYLCESLEKMVLITCKRCHDTLKKFINNIKRTKGWMGHELIEVISQEEQSVNNFKK